MSPLLLLTRFVRIVVPPGTLAMGVTLGGALLGGWGEWLVGQPSPPYADIAWRIRIWAMAIAIGGTQTAFENLERQLLTGGLTGIGRDLAIVAAAYLGAQLGYRLIRWLTVS
ncbi:MAG: sporulation protein [Firmicutes bacterium]|nr:sporulation protein [Bacillota bacterium]